MVVARAAVIVAGVPVVADMTDQRIGRIVVGVGVLGPDAVAIGVAEGLVVLLAPLDAGGDGHRARREREGLAADVEAGHRLDQLGTLTRAVLGHDVVHSRRIQGHLTEDVQRHAAAGAGDRVAADDRAVRAGDRVDGGVVARRDRDVVHVQADAVHAVGVVGVVLPVRAEQIVRTGEAQHEPLLFALDVDVDRPEPAVAGAECEAGDVIGGAGRLDRGCQERVVALDRQAGPLGADIRLVEREDLGEVGRCIDFIVVAELIGDAGVGDLALDARGEGRRSADAGRLVAAHAERAEAVGHRTRAGRNAVRAVLELTRLAARAEGDALQRAVRDQAVLGVLDLLGVVDDAVLRQAIGGRGQRAHLDGGRREPVAAAGLLEAETAGQDAGFTAELAAGGDAQTVVEERLADRHLGHDRIVVVILALAALQAGLEALEGLVGDEVDHAADGVRAIRGRGPAGDHVDLLDQQLRELADVGHAVDVGGRDALAVQQGQGARGAQAAQAQRAKTLLARAGAVGADRPAGAALQGRHLDDGLEDVGLRGLLQVFRRDRGGRRRLGEASRIDARTGDHHFGDDRVVASRWSGLLCVSHRPPGQ